VPDTLADATVGADLVVVEGMGRAIHTNYRCLLFLMIHCSLSLTATCRGDMSSPCACPSACRSKFKCAALKLAMIKNQHLAETLFGGSVYDCVCLYEPPS
jgi:type II pantothenate kinase